MRRANARWVVERAILDLRLEAPPNAPVTYLDTVVPHPCAATFCDGAAGTCQDHELHEDEELVWPEPPPTNATAHEPEVRGRTRRSPHAEKMVGGQSGILRVLFDSHEAVCQLRFSVLYSSQFG